MRNIFALLLMVNSTFNLSCQNELDIPTAKDHHTLLWEISGNGLSRPSYFLGTMHIMCADDAVLSANTLQVLKTVEQVYLEVDMDNVDELFSGIGSISMKGDKTLADFLSKNKYAKVQSFFEQYQPSLPFSVIERQQPLMLSASIYELFLPCDNKNGIDLRIIYEASRLKKQTRGFETLAFQTSIFDSIPYKDQAEELVKTIDSISKYRDAMEQMIRVYKLQDIEKLHELTTKEEAGVSSYLDLLLYDRNRKWVQQFKGIAEIKTTLFAVGAGHLGGAQGVINLLKQKGYTIRPLVN